MCRNSWVNILNTSFLKWFTFPWFASSLANYISWSPPLAAISSSPACRHRYRIIGDVGIIQWEQIRHDSSRDTFVIISKVDIFQLHHPLDLVVFRELGLGTSQRWRDRPPTKGCRQKWLDSPTYILLFTYSIKEEWILYN